MANWEYILKTSQDLKDTLSNKQYEEVLEYLKRSWSEIYHAFPETYDWDDLREDVSYILVEEDKIKNYQKYDLTEEDVEKIINKLLNNLQEYCEPMHILVDI